MDDTQYMTEHTTDTLLQQAVDSILTHYDSSYYIEAYDYNIFNDRIIENILNN